MVSVRVEPNWRSITNSTIDRMVEAVHTVVDMRARDVDEATVTLALAEAVEHIRTAMQMQFDGHEVY